MGKKFLIILAAGAVGLAGHAENLPQPSDNKTEAVLRVMADSRALEGVPLKEVVLAATGCKVLSIDKVKDQAWLDSLGQVLDRVLKNLNDPNHAVQAGGRINEASRFIEDELLIQLNVIPGWKGSIPKTSSHSEQRSGYPDLRLQLGDDRIVYLDPKLHAEGSRSSSFRTFYFEPRQDTLKITEDAIHLLVSVSHSPRPGGGIFFSSWELIDVANMPLRLKAEFQASNREIFEKADRVGRSQPVPAGE